MSGGQLYRINLARAVYSRPDIFLLDNPLCAIDVATARNIYENLLGKNGLLKNIVSNKHLQSHISINFLK